MQQLFLIKGIFLIFSTILPVNFMYDWGSRKDKNVLRRGIAEFYILLFPFFQYAKSTLKSALSITALFLVAPLVHFVKSVRNLYFPLQPFH